MSEAVKSDLSRLADLEREPVLYNSHLGHYTNFVNFFGLSGLALRALDLERDLEHLLREVALGRGHVQAEFGPSNGRGHRAGARGGRREAAAREQGFDLRAAERFNT